MYKTRLKISVLMVLTAVLSLSAACAKGVLAQPTPSPSDISPVNAEATPSPTPSPIPSPDRSAAYIYENNPSLTPVDYSSSAILPPTEDAGQEYIDKITFLGDSTTYGFIYYESLKDGKKTKQVWTGFDGTITLSFQSTIEIRDPEDGTAKTIRECAELHKPEFLIITLGLNGISFMDKEYFVTEYKSLVTDINALSPDTTLVLQSIYPISPLYIHWGSITNDLVTQANSWILEIAEETDSTYLDTFSVLVGDDGNIKREYESGDGIHLSPLGLSAVLSYIRTHAFIPVE